MGQSALDIDSVVRMRGWLFSGLAVASALVVVTPASASEGSQTPAGASPVKSSHCHWMGVNSPPGGTSYASTTVNLGNADTPAPATFEAWTYCIGNHWKIGARFDGLPAWPFVWTKGVAGVQTPGLVVTQMLEIYPGAAPVIVVSTGTGYNWTTYDFFTVRRSHVVPFIGGVGYHGKYPMQLRDSGGIGDYFHFSCTRAGNGALDLVQQEYDGPKFFPSTSNPRTYEVSSETYTATSGTRFSARKMASRVTPANDLSFAPSEFC